MRNFLYNKSDILAAAVIVIVAIVIIWTRIDTIMKSQNPAVTKPADKTVSASKDKDTKTDSSSADDGTVTAGDTKTKTKDTGSKSTTNDGTVKREAGQPVAFTVQSGMSSGDIAIALKDLKLIASVEEFNTAVKNSGMETKLRDGTFSIPAGSSVDQIIKILTMQ